MSFEVLQLPHPLTSVILLHGTVNLENHNLPFVVPVQNRAARILSTRGAWAAIAQSLCNTALAVVLATTHRQVRLARNVSADLAVEILGGGVHKLAAVATGGRNPAPNSLRTFNTGPSTLSRGCHVRVYLFCNFTGW